MVSLWGEGGTGRIYSGRRKRDDALSRLKISAADGPMLAPTEEKGGDWLPEKIMVRVMRLETRRGRIRAIRRRRDPVSHSGAEASDGGAARAPAAGGL